MSIFCMALDKAHPAIVSLKPKVVGDMWAEKEPIEHNWKVA